MSTATPALAVIEGSICQFNRTGLRAAGHAPLATAVVEFQQGSLRYYVREHTFGLLPGLPNLYCLDGAFRLQWMAEWPDHAGLEEASDDAHPFKLATSPARQFLNSSFAETAESARPESSSFKRPRTSARTFEPRPERCSKTCC